MHQYSEGPQKVALILGGIHDFSVGVRASGVLWEARLRTNFFLVVQTFRIAYMMCFVLQHVRPWSHGGSCGGKLGDPGGAETVNVLDGKLEQWLQRSLSQRVSGFPLTALIQSCTTQTSEEVCRFLHSKCVL